jgi:hypothetical protein
MQPAGDKVMSAIHWLELGAAVLLIVFIVFAFRQGMKVRPLEPDEQPPVSRYIIPGWQLVGNPPRIQRKSRQRGAGFVSRVLHAFFRAGRWR